MARVNTSACIVYIDGAEFDGIYIVDGLGIMWDGVYNSEIIRVVQEALRAGKMVAAVGHGVGALCNVTDDRGNFIVAGKQVDSNTWMLDLSSPQHRVLVHFRCFRISKCMHDHIWHVKDTSDGLRFDVVLLLAPLPAQSGCWFCVRKAKLTDVC